MSRLTTNPWRLRAALTFGMGALAAAAAPVGRVGAQGAALTCTSPGGTTYGTQTLATGMMWTRAGSPYRLTGALTLSGAATTLVVQPGTLVCATLAGRLTLDGGARMDAHGTALEPVVFTASDSVQGWSGLTFQGTPASPSRLVNVRVAHTGMSPGGTSGIVAIGTTDSHPVVIDSAVIHHIRGAAAYLYRGSRISRSLIDSVRSAAETIWLGDSTTFEDTQIDGGTVGVRLNGVGIRLLGGRITRTTSTGIFGGFETCLMEARPVRVAVSNGTTVALSAADLTLLYPTPAALDSLRRDGTLPDTIGLHGGELTGRDLTLVSTFIYRVEGSVLLGPGVTMYVQPGTQVLFGTRQWDPQGALMFDRSRLVARGTATAPIRFSGGGYVWPILGFRGTPPDTSFVTNVHIDNTRRAIGAGARVDTIRGVPTWVEGDLLVLDSVRIRQSGAPVTLGRGARISRTIIETVTGVPTGSLGAIETGTGTLIEQTELRQVDVGVFLRGADVRLRDVAVRGFLRQGIQGDTGSDHLAEAQRVRLTGGRAYECSVVALSISDLAVLAPTPAEQDSLTGPSCNRASLLGGRLEGRALTLGPSLTYQDAGELAARTSVGAGGTLTILPGVELRQRPGAGLVVGPGGRLVARGTAAAPIRFLRDGLYASDAWAGLEFTGAAGDTAVLEHVLLENAHWGLRASTSHVVRADHVRIRRITNAAVILGGAGSTLDASTIDTTLTASGASVILGAGTRLGGTTVHGAPGTGVEVIGTDVQLRQCTVTGSGAVGVAFTAGASGSVHDCNLTANVGVGVHGVTPGSVDARWNWWGNARGPLAVGGDGVSSGVAFDPWLSQSIDIDNPRRTVVRTRVSPDTVRLTSLGQVVQLSAQLYEGSMPIDGALTWGGNAPHVATVTPTGLATAVANGTAYAVATPVGGGAPDSVRIEVDSPTYATSCAALGGSTHASGAYLASETWTRGASPHRVERDVTFTGVGVVLAIEPGALVCVAADAAIRLRGGARLDARGTAASPIVLTPSDATTPWYGLSFDGVAPDTSRLVNVLLDRSRWGVRADALHRVAIDSARIRWTDSVAVTIAGNGSRISRSTIDTTLRATYPAVTIGDSATFEETVVRGAAGTGVALGGEGSGRRLLGGRVEGSGGIGIDGASPPTVASVRKLREARPVRVTGSGGYAVRLTLPDFAVLYPAPSDQDSLVGNRADTASIASAIGVNLTQPLALGAALPFRIEQGDPRGITRARRVGIDAGGVLEVRAGARLAFAPGAGLYFDGGQLVVRGSAEAPALFTAVDPAAPWFGIGLHSVQPILSSVVHARFEYADIGVVSYYTPYEENFPRHAVAIDSSHFRQMRYGAAYVAGVGARIRHSVIDTVRTIGLSGAAVALGWHATFEDNVVRGSGAAGISFEGGDVRLLGGLVEGSRGVGITGAGDGSLLVEARPVRVTGGATFPVALGLGELACLYPTLESRDSLLGNADDRIRITGGRLGGCRLDLTLDAKLPVSVAAAAYLTDQPTVGSHAQLVVLPGARIAFDSSARLVVDGGRITIRGTASQPIVLTASDPAKPWSGLFFGGFQWGDTSRVTNARIEYAGGPIEAMGVHPVILDSVQFWRPRGIQVRLGAAGSRLSRVVVDSGAAASLTCDPNSTTWGCNLRPAVVLTGDVLLEESVIRRAIGSGVEIQGPRVRITRCHITDNIGEGILLTSADVTGVGIHDCNLERNGSDGVRMPPGAVAAVDARWNWWGDPAGPLGPQGDGVSSNVLYDPWLTRRVDIHNPPSHEVAYTVVTPDSARLSSAGATLQLAAQLYEGTTPVAGTFAWSTRDARVATVSASGLVTAVADGVTWVVASPPAPALADSAFVRVAIPPRPALAIAIVAPSHDTTVSIGDRTWLAAHTDDPADSLTITWRLADGRTLAGATPGWVRFTGALADTIVATATRDAQQVTAVRIITVPARNVVPVVTFAAPASDTMVVERDSLRFRVVARDDDGRITEYRWDMGDGRTASGATLDTLRHAFAAPGAYRVIVRVVDDSAAVSAPDTVTVTVVHANVRPVATIVAPAADTTVIAGDSVFVAGAGTDTDGTIVGWTWQLDDTHTRTVRAPGWITYTTAGRHALTLVVTDDSGTVSLPDTTWITVRANALPTVAIVTPAADTTLYVGDSVRVLATASDVDGDAVTVRWTVATGDTIAGTGPHWLRFVKGGSYAVTATARDTRGSTSIAATRTVTVTGRGTNVDVTSRNSDGRVDGHDVVFVIRARRTQDLRGDVNGDGVVDDVDARLVRAALGHKSSRANATGSTP